MKGIMKLAVTELASAGSRHTSFYSSVAFAFGFEFYFNLSMLDHHIFLLDTSGCVSCILFSLPRVAILSTVSHFPQFLFSAYAHLVPFALPVPKTLFDVLVCSFLELAETFVALRLLAREDIGLKDLINEVALKQIMDVAGLLEPSKIDLRSTRLHFACFHFSPYLFNNEELLDYRALFYQLPQTRTKKNNKTKTKKPKLILSVRVFGGGASIAIGSNQAAHQHAFESLS